MGNVVFDEEPRDSFAIPARQSGEISKMLVRLKFAGSVKRASILLLGGAVLLVAGSIYFLALAVPPPPELGADVLRPGEQIPEYAR